MTTKIETTTKARRTTDPELAALGKIMSILATLETDARVRVVDYMVARTENVEPRAEAGE